MGRFIIVVAVGASLSASLLAGLAAVPARSASAEPQAALPALAEKPEATCTSAAWPYRPASCAGTADLRQQDAASGVSGERLGIRQVRVISLDRRDDRIATPVGAARTAPARQ